MEYKLLVRDCFSLWRTTKEVRLSGVDTILKPGLLDDNKGNTDYGMANDGFPIDDDIPF